nr:hypothetical protein [Tanacetum cinerariifolium]
TNIHIAEEEKIKREHADYINRMEMLFTVNPRPHPQVFSLLSAESEDTIFDPGFYPE